MREQSPNIATGAIHERGLAAVEFAIILPVVLLIMLATAELGRAFYQDNTLAKAVRDGARYLADQAIDGTTGVIALDTTKQSQTKNLVIYGNTAGTGAPLLPGLAPEQITITSPDPLHVHVSAAYPYQPIFASLPGFGMTADISTIMTLSAATTMRAL